MRMMDTLEGFGPPTPPQRVRGFRGVVIVYEMMMEVCIMVVGESKGGLFRRNCKLQRQHVYIYFPRIFMRLVASISAAAILASFCHRQIFEVGLLSSLSNDSASDRHKVWFRRVANGTIKEFR